MTRKLKEKNVTGLDNNFQYLGKRWRNCRRRGDASFPGWHKKNPSSILD